VLERDGDPSVIRECSAAFASGCYHGVLEASLEAGGQLDMARLQQLCSAAGSSASPGPTYECIHGLGHGVLGAVGFDIHAALHHCDRLSGAAFIASCHSGAFMEAISSAFGAATVHDAHAHDGSGDDGGSMASGGRLTINASDPYSPCDKFRDPYATSCWLFQGFVILHRTGFSAARALKLCDGAPDGRTARCYESVGHQLTGLFQHDDRWIVQHCAAGAPAFAPKCAAGAALALDALDWSGSRAAKFCAAVPPGWKEACYRSAANALTALAAPAERDRLCSTVEVRYVAVCREAGALPRGAGS
jgi:hypothetical protein